MRFTGESEQQIISSPLDQARTINLDISQKLNMCLNPTTVLIDFDGPLVDIFDYETAINATRKIISIAKYFGLDNRYEAEDPRYIDEWKKFRLLMLDNPTLLKEFNLQVHKSIEEIEYSSMKSAAADKISLDLISAASDKFKNVCIVSNNSRLVIWQWLHMNRIMRKINFVSARTSEMNPDLMKPNSYLLESALAHVNAKPNQCIFIGDTEADATCCHSAGVRFIGILTRHSPDKQKTVCRGAETWLQDRTAALNLLLEY